MHRARVPTVTGGREGWVREAEREEIQTSPLDLSVDITL